MPSWAQYKLRRGVDMGDDEPVVVNDERCEHGHHHGHEGHVHNQAPLNELAIVGVITAVLFWPVGLVTSLMARREAHRRGERGEGLALVGITISALSGFFLTVVCVAVLAGGIGVGGGPFRGHGEFGFVHQGTVMRVAPGGPVTRGGGQCVTSGAANSGQTSITCTNGNYVNPGGPMVPSSSPVGTAPVSGGGGPGPSWTSVGPAGAIGGGVGAVAGSSR